MRWQALKTRLVERLLGDALESRIQQAVAVERTRVQQALPIAFGRDRDLAGFRRLTASGQDVAALRDLPVPTQERMQELAYRLYLLNPMAKWWINTVKNYVVGKGVTVKATAPDTQAVLDAWWTDAVNAWPKKLRNKVRELGLYGEQCYPAFTAPGTGRVRLGYLDPSLIQEVVLDPDNAEQPIGVITKKQPGILSVPERRFRVILPIGEEELTPLAQRAREGFSDGECFYFAINKVSNGSRGISDLLDKADWLDGYEQFIFQRLERGDLMNRIIFDLELQGMSPEQINEFRKQFTLPNPGGVHFHNEKVKLTATAPDLKAQDAAADARLFKHQALAPMPEHWFGGGGDVNRATAGEMDEPTFKAFEDRRGEVKALVEECGRYAVLQAKRTGRLAQHADESFQALFDEMVTADVAGLSAAAQQVASAVAVMRTQGLLTKSEGRMICAIAVKALGAELAPKTDEELVALMAADAFNEASQDYRQPARGIQGQGVEALWAAANGHGRAR